MVVDLAKEEAEEQSRGCQARGGEAKQRLIMATKLEEERLIGGSLQLSSQRRRGRAII